MLSLQEQKNQITNLQCHIVLVEHFARLDQQRRAVVLVNVEGRDLPHVVGIRDGARNAVARTCGNRRRVAGGAAEPAGQRVGLAGVLLIRQHGLCNHQRGLRRGLDAGEHVVGLAVVGLRQRRHLIDDTLSTEPLVRPFTFQEAPNHSAGLLPVYTASAIQPSGRGETDLGCLSRLTSVPLGTCSGGTDWRPKGVRYMRALATAIMTNNRSIIRRSLSAFFLQTFFPRTGLLIAA